MSIEKVSAFFALFNMDHQIVEFDVSSATVALAAVALNCESARIAKTLAFESKGQAFLVVAAGDARIDNAKFKSTFGCRPEMLCPDDVRLKIGFEIGGVCPFAVNDDVPVYLDVSLKRFDTIFPACGSNNSAIELTPEQLAHYANSTQWVDVCKDWRD
jgi:prolyl-tRNA editing enzyme YbaK/EbsC (Cys-tRNA(Pro) deacylase)